MPKARVPRLVVSFVLLLTAWAFPVAAQVLEDASSNAPALARSVPASRQADNVAIITIKGPITAITELSVNRRIEQAEASGADAMVFEIDSPGGEVGAVLSISGAIKSSSITNTVAWVRPQAFSGGAIIALACREIVTSSPASMGDALIILQTPMGVVAPTKTERTKFLPPLLSDVVDSARRNGFDEYLAQAIGTDGIELWAVQHAETGEWLFINEAEYAVLFDGEPPRTNPVLAGVPDGATREDTLAIQREQAEAEELGLNGPGTGSGETSGDTPSDEDDVEAGDEVSDAAEGDDGTDSDPDAEGPSLAEREVDPARAFRPATPELDELFNESGELSPPTVTQRPRLSEADRGTWIDPIYVCDGTAAVVLSDTDLQRFDLSEAIINNDTELESYFGAKNMTRTDRSWSESLVGFLTKMPVRGVLIVVFLLALFIELTSPGLIVPGAVALTALVALLAPPALIGMAGWWEIAAIGIGICLILVELLILPGFGVFGVLGLVSLFGGLVGTFIPDGSGGLFPGGAAQTNALYGIVTILLATATSGVGVYFIARHFGTIPFIGRLVLQDPEPAVDPALQIAGEAAGVGIGPRSVGVATTSLRPSGLVEVEGDVVDAVSEMGFIEQGTRVAIVKRRGFSWVVEPAGDDDQAPADRDSDEGTRA